MTKEQLLEQYENLNTRMMTPVNILVLVEEWLHSMQGTEDGYFEFIANKERYTDILTVAIENLTHLSNEHYQFIEGEIKK